MQMFLLNQCRERYHNKYLIPTEYETSSNWNSLPSLSEGTTPIKPRLSQICTWTVNVLVFPVNPPWARCRESCLRHWHGAAAPLKTTTSPPGRGESAPTQSRSHEDFLTTDRRSKSDTGTCSTTRPRWWSTPSHINDRLIDWGVDLRPT